MLDWDDLRFVLAVSRTGSALAAARELGVNQTTVTRRLAHLEASTGEHLFERHQSGYRLTGPGQRVAATAETVEAQVLALQSDMAARRRVVSGAVRFTCPETVANHLLAPWLRHFHLGYPEVRIEVIVSDTMLDLGKGEADVAMRIGAPPAGSGVVAPPPARLPIDRLLQPQLRRRARDPANAGRVARPSAGRPRRRPGTAAERGLVRAAGRA